MTNATRQHTEKTSFSLAHDIDVIVCFCLLAHLEEVILSTRYY